MLIAENRPSVQIPYFFIEFYTYTYVLFSRPGMKQYILFCVLLFLLKDCFSVVLNLRKQFFIALLYAMIYLYYT